jgi:histidine ammonia-lyase
MSSIAPELFTDLLRQARGGAASPLTPAERSSLEAEHMHLQAMVAAGVQVYGTSTNVGHRDGVAASSAETLWQDIVVSHAIGEAPWCPDETARLITAAKLSSWRAGGSGVSLALFDHVAALTADPGFRPQVPQSSSYSSGDVIPATHWARAVLQGTAASGAFAGPPEPMPLINGAFVHLGQALALLQPLRAAWVAFFANSASLVRYGMRNRSFLLSGIERRAVPAQAALQQLRSAVPMAYSAVDRQDAVSLRATDEVFETLLLAIANFGEQLALALQRPSGNPLIDVRHGMPLSQASFMLPTLSLAQSGLIEAILFAMWACVGRLSYVLSGELPGVPRDGVSAKGALGFIQRPKQMMALLEEARLLAGRRSFASGGATSYGIEDLWSQGVPVTRSLAQLIVQFQSICRIEATVLAELFGPNVEGTDIQLLSPDATSSDRGFPLVF